MASKEPYIPPPETKYCFIKTCKNNSIVTPHKRFFSVPAGNKAEWCRAAGFDRIPKSSLLICEDHLDLEQDMENYLYWKMMKGKARLKTRLPAFLAEPSTSSASTDGQAKPSTSSVGIMCCPAPVNRHIQAKPLMRDQTTSCCLSKKAPRKRKFEEIALLSDSSLAPSCAGSTYESLEEEEEDTPSSNTPMQKNVGRNVMLAIVHKKPMQYLGLHKDYYWIIDYLDRTCNTVNTLSIITTLYRIKNDDTFSKISDLFDISLTTLWRSYFPTLIVLSKFFKQFVYWPPKTVIKKKLPDAFKVHKDYSQIQAIIDCFEVQIQQPSNPVEQSHTWSQYKSCNTAKFLISATPDGFINFISIGYGGRMSDIALVEQCGFIDIIPPNCAILAYRGFKHLEPILSSKGIKLVRPPTVYSNKQSTKEEVLTTKVIASLRVHIERVIRRVRMYSLLKPHSTVNNKLTNTLDNVVQVACGLINLQSPIIRNK